MIRRLSLLKKLAGKLSDEKEDLVSERLKLWRELDTSSINKGGSIVNPHTIKLNEIRSLRDELDRSLADIRLRSQELISSLTPADNGAGKLDPLQVKVAAIEAKEYLNFSRTNVSEAEAVPKVNDDAERQWQVLQQRVWDMESEVSDLRGELLARSYVVGTGHGDIVALKKTNPISPGRGIQIDRPDGRASV